MPANTSADGQRGATGPVRASGSPPLPGASGPLEAPSRPPFWRTRRFWLTVAIVAAINWFLAPLIVPDSRDRLTTSYTFFTGQVAAGNVAEITSRGDVIQGQLRTAVTDPNPPTSTLFGPREPRAYTKFETTVPAFANTDQLASLLETNKVVMNARPIEEARNPLLTFLLTFGPAILLIAALFWVSSRATGASGRLFGIGRSQAKRYVAAADSNRVTFEDVAGIDEAEHELVEIVDFLREPDKYARLGGRIPRGVLLVGAPGTGKTLLARAVAGEADVPFFSMSGSEFIEMIVGVGASRVRDLFNQAKASAPAIIFVDELDAIGRRRGAGNIVGGHDEREQTLNQLLVEMDGFDSRQVVIVLGATNRADVLDPALLRPGRFDRRVVVQAPDREGRTAILRVHCRGVPLDGDVLLESVAAQTPGLVGADLANLVNEAALLAARKGQTTVRQGDFAEALERIALGAERRLALTPADRERVAYHEAGHALLGLLQPEGDPVRRVTVVPRGQALGVTLSVPDDDRYNYSEAYLRARLVSALGGRAAEAIVYGDVTTGAENDLKQVTDLARAMVTRWGMSQEVGLLSLASRDEGNFLEAGLLGGAARAYSEEMAQAVDAATRRIIDESFARALDLLRREQSRLEALARALLRDESLDEQQILAATGLTPKQAAVRPLAPAD